MKGLPARTGLEWLKQGLTLFRQQPGILMMVVFTSLMIFMLLSQLPLIGTLIAFAALPSFIMAIQQACRLIDEGQRVHPKVMLTGFSGGAIKPLFKLGLIYMAIFLAFGTAAIMLLDPAWVKAAQASMVAKQQPVIDGHTLLVMCGVMLAMGMTLMTLSFAPGLTYWKRMPTFKAIFYSFFAVLGAKGPMAVMLFAWIGIVLLVQAIIGVLFGASGIAQVILSWFSFIGVLIFQCATYAAYKQIMGAPEDEAARAK